MACESGSSVRDWLFLRGPDSHYLMHETYPVYKIPCLMKLTIHNVHIKNHIYCCNIPLPHAFKLGSDVHNKSKPEL
jgi:hypothetical protein